MFRFVLCGMMLCAVVPAGAVPKPQVRAARALIERVTPGYGRQFHLELMPSVGGADVFEIGQRRGNVLLRGTSAVALATAYNQYLKSAQLWRTYQPAWRSGPASLQSVCAGRTPCAPCLRLGAFYGGHRAESGVL